MPVPILMYHAIGEPRSLLSITPADFTWQMNWLYKNNFQVLSLAEVVGYLQQRKTLPARSVTITFDDGFEGVYRHAFPVLARYGFSATVFLVAGYCGQVNNWPNQPASIPILKLSGWSQVYEMDRFGIEFGSHSLSHPRLDHLPAIDVEREINSSKRIIEEHLCHSIDFFAFPYGQYNRLVQTFVRQTYSGACTTSLGLASKRNNPFEMPRIDIYYLREPSLFRLLSNPILSVYLSQRRKLRAAASMILRRAWR